jgi:O-methyltransferase
MFGYLKRRYAASIEYRLNVAVQKLEARLLEANQARIWSSGADPFELHSHAAVDALAQGVAAIYGYDIAGDIAEFGTMSGRTAAGLAKAIASCDKQLKYAVQMYGHAPRKLVLFDSFEGLPEIKKNSVDGDSPHVVDGVWSPGSLRGVSPDELSSMIRIHLASDRFEIHPGWFSATLPALGADRRFALIHVDSDLYSSAIDVLDNLFSRGRISRGAYIYFDDWNCNRADPDRGERRAWRECVEKFEVAYSDIGSYGIFAQRFVVHSYRGSPEDIPGQSQQARAQQEQLASAQAEQKIVISGSSSDNYDHQEASKHYHQASGLSDMDPPFLPVYERCRQFSMTSPDRMYALYKAVQYIQQASIEGGIVECGVWRGGSMMVVAEALKMFGGPERHLHLFDTYEGLPEPTPEDVDVWGNDAESWWKQKRTSDRSSDWARAHLDEVQHNMNLTGFPEKSITYVKGMVEDTIPTQAPDKISLLRLDTDWYASTKHEMQHLFPRLSRNGILIIDDYGHFKGAKQAIDEYLMAADVPLMLIRIDYTGRIAIKTHG